MMISYTTKRGGYMSRRIEPANLRSELDKMIKRGIESRVQDADGNEVGATWKEAGCWRWYFDPEAT